jgi:hypothetical protein
LTCVGGWEKIAAVRSNPASGPGFLGAGTRWRWGVVTAALALTLAAPARADLEAAEDDEPLEVHAFVSQGFIKTTANNYLADSERGSFELNEVGINFTKALGDRLRLGLQLFSNDIGPIGDYRAKVDWFYLDYRFFDWLGVRAGRVKLPFGLYNDINDVDSARVPVLLPQSVYSIRSRNFLLAQTGVEVYGYKALDGAGSLDYRAYAGTIYVEVDPNNNPSMVSNLRIPLVTGGRLLWETPLPGLRLGGTVQALRFEFGLPVLPPAKPGGPAGVQTTKLYGVLWLSSVEYAKGDLLLSAEYGRWHVKVDPPLPMQPAGWYWSERMYAMASYRMGPRFTPGLYYSLLFPDSRRYSLFSGGTDAHHGHREDYQHDVAASLRFDLTAHWLLKLEGHFMRGTADLQSQQNDNTPARSLTRDWGVFMAKTTAYF